MALRDTVIDPLLSRLDLNLLVSLDALLTERSVTRAAGRLQLSQPTLSASLARLRTHFGDPILARHGNSYELTPLALRLSEHTMMAIEATRRVFETQAIWSPATSTREFVVYGSDHGFVTIGAEVSRLAAQEAPGVRFRFALQGPSVVDEAAIRLRSVDGIVLPHGYLTGLPYLDLWRDRWVVLADSSNDVVGDELTMAALSELPWVFTYQSRTAFTSAARELQHLGIEPRVDAVVESFLALPRFIVGTRRLGLLQAGLVDAAPANPALRVLQLPFDATPIVNALWWHAIHEPDPGHVWMRDIFSRASRHLSTV